MSQTYSVEAANAEPRHWYHTGENLAIRQLLRHTNRQEFVGAIDGEAPFRVAE